MISIKHMRGRRSWTGLALLFLTIFIKQIVVAESVDDEIFARRAAAEYHLAQARWQAATNVSPAAWEFARACFNLADEATNDETRASLAVQGIEASRRLLKEQPASGAGHYWLAMNLGQLARTELLGALALVREMESEFKTAWSLDTTMDYAGAARNLGTLYRDAPGWPTSIGSKRKAKEWLERAAHTAPDFPENWLILTETYLEWDEPEAARVPMHQLVKIWPAALTNFTGVAWEEDWADWKDRRTKAQAQLDEHAADGSSARKNR